MSTASNQGLVGRPHPDGAYACAKAGVVQLVRSVATQYGRFGVRCNVGVARRDPHAGARARVPARRSSPRSPSTSLVPRVGEAEDLANAVLFLASDESSYITGHVIPVDGGQLVHLPHYSSMTKTGATTTYQE